MSIFKPCDIRGIYKRELNRRDAYDLGRAAGVLARGKDALVAGDVRLSTPVLKTALCQGLIKAGCRVIDAGILTTPAFYFAAHRTACTIGIMVTASHNPPEYNGFKLLLEGSPVNQGELNSLQEIMAKQDFINGSGSCTQQDIWLKQYHDFIIGHFQPVKRRIVLDCGNGTCSLIAPEIFRTLGYNATELYCQPDGRFPNRSPNPALPESLSVLRQMVITEKAAIGIAYDGDGDRVSFVDETGQSIENDRILAILVRHLLSRENGVVVYDSKCSMVVAEEVARWGGTSRMARSGHGFVGQEFLARNALLAGELSGHFFWRDLGFDDGIFSSLVLLELLGESQLTLSQMDHSLPRYLITPEIRIPFLGYPEELINIVAQKLSDFPFSRIDGVRVEFGDCWGMIRPSITEPIITLRFEAKEREKLSFIVELILSALPGEIQLNVEEIIRTADTSG